ncbi:MAG: hypothetical protein A2508_05615 [Candidatus Lambdaproteobacteria bacterium RIFOXYD12_FULL_49_8]|uniref:Uncharacterized protein n=1 Tax=Candidatus Lambdaproteobacteria bacterium RIFOXYD2_FULL_50_16 TaxID=1817772 RepID=A0A1F6G7E2_9PROT|nr:MAG: hypothetical protein A2527_09220 [Candidatus Lambdaproteobacteria bacterium RIFOXYD2_FULL_50_16]OGG98397.1 MAG: hypothetical protein A2508_05615 [Candidatus Lambdaproteobacteria bacterium RIFOXYD12_FULL_49_8]
MWVGAKVMFEVTGTQRAAVLTERVCCTYFQPVALSRLLLGPAQLQIIPPIAKTGAVLLFSAKPKKGGATLGARRRFFGFDVEITGIAIVTPGLPSDRHQAWTFNLVLRAFSTREFFRLLLHSLHRTKTKLNYSKS